MKWVYVPVLWVLSGCPGPEAPPVDASVDATSGTSLVLTWASVPDPIPGPATSNERIERAVFRIAEVRCIGDVGSARQLRVVLEWAASIAPADGVLTGALAGIYSRLELELDRGADAYAYEISGTTEISGDTTPFTIRDRDLLAVSDDYAPFQLPPGERVEVPISIELDRVVSDVDFDALPVIEGRRTLQTGDPQMSAVRIALRDAFRLRGP